MEEAEGGWVAVPPGKQIAHRASSATLPRVFDSRESRQELEVDGIDGEVIAAGDQQQICPGLEQGLREVGTGGDAPQWIRAGRPIQDGAGEEHAGDAVEVEGLAGVGVKAIERGAVRRA